MNRILFVALLLPLFGLAPLGCGPDSPGNAKSGSSNATVVRGTRKLTPAKATAPPEEVPPGEVPVEPEKKPGPVKFKERKANAGPKAALAVPAESTRKLHEPIVALTQGHAAKCLVKVGDNFPELKLPEVGGSDEDLSQLRGEKLTIVVFWNSRKVYAAEQFAQLKTEVASAYSKFGVNVIAVNVGDTPDTVARLARQYEIDFPCLVDADGAAFKLVGQDMLPRTYLLDPQGKILWFDIEYSQTTIRELDNAVYYFLKSGGS